MEPHDFKVEFKVNNRPTKNTFLKLCRKIRTDFKFLTVQDYITFKRLIFRNDAKHEKRITDKRRQQYV